MLSHASEEQGKTENVADSTGALFSSSNQCINDQCEEEITWTVHDDKVNEVYAHTMIRTIQSTSPVVHNIVSKSHLSHLVDLERIALQARNVEYNPKRFSAAVMRIRDPRSTSLLFRTGKMIILGTTCIRDSKRACRKFAKAIGKILKVNIKIEHFQVHNIVSTFDAGFKINLFRLGAEHHKFCQYEPMIFPGLAYKLLQPKLTLIVFVSGKVVITGAKSCRDIYFAHKKIMPVLFAFSLLE